MNKIDKLIKKGAVILNETKEYVTLEIPKKFNLLWFILWFGCFNVFGILVYVIYLNKHKKVTIKRLD